MNAPTRIGRLEMPYGDQSSWVWNDWQMALAEHYANSMPLSRRHTAVQAGGNVGCFAISFSKVFAVTLVFEPVPQNFECLQRNVNNWCSEEERKRLRLADWALGERYGAANISYNTINPAASWLTDARNPNKPPEEQRPGDVMVCQLDYQTLSSLDLLQLDVEGYELAALRGAFEHISQHKPVIIMEMCRHSLHLEAAEEIEQRRDLLWALGYQDGYEVSRMDIAFDEVFYPVGWSHAKMEPFSRDDLKPHLTKRGWISHDDPKSPSR